LTYLFQLDQIVVAVKLEGAVHDATEVEGCHLQVEARWRTGAAGRVSGLTLAGTHLKLLLRLFIDGLSTIETFIAETVIEPTKLSI
jgi:hypothetical protein